VVVNVAVCQLYRHQRFSDAVLVLVMYPVTVTVALAVWV
jgi:hypothetical protein